MKAEAVFASDCRARRQAVRHLEDRMADCLADPSQEARLLAAMAALPPDLRERAEYRLRQARRARIQAR